MTRPVRTRLALLLVLLAGALTAIGPVGLAIGADSGGDTSAVAINTKDGSSVFKLAFAIRRVTGDVVDNQNAAVSYASCTECQTVAISIQILLVASDPSTFTPTNLALALNENCDLCDTLATAYQFAVGIGTHVHFTHEGRQAVHEIFKQLQDLKRSGLTGPEIQAKVDGLMDQLGTVISTQLVASPVEEPKGPADGQAPAEPTSTTPDEGTTTQTTPTTTTTTPTETTPSETTTTPTDSTQTTTTTTP